MSKDTISVNMNVYDIPIVVELLKKLEQKNKQLNKKLKEKQKIIDEIEYFVSNEYIYDEVGMKIIDRSKLQDKIQELKEKYK